jgi:probable F420-dependent oxidoreductase
MIDMQELPALARHAEDLGFEGVSMGEHLITFSEQYEHYDYSKDSMIRWYPETHWPEPWVQIAALSQITSTLKFLTSIYVLPMHDPFSVAKLVSTAANISEGRVILGAGIGWQKSEFQLVEQDFHTRGRRCDEMLEVMNLLWTGKPVSFDGDFYTFPSLQMSPGLDHELPVYIGGFADAALQRAARHNGWIGGQHEMSEVEQFVPALHRHCEAIGKEPKDFDICLGLYEMTPETIERCKELGVTQLYRHAFCDENGMASVMSLDDKLRDMDRFAEQYLA